MRLELVLILNAAGIISVNSPPSKICGKFVQIGVKAFQYLKFQSSKVPKIQSSKDSKIQSFNEIPQFFCVILCVLCEAKRL